MRQQCKVNHKVDVPVCIVAVGFVVGAGWAFKHGYTGQPFIEAFIPVMIIAGVFTLVAILVGWITWRWSRKS